MYKGSILGIFLQRQAYHQYTLLSLYFRKKKTETTYHHKLTELKYLWELIAHAKEEKKKI